jgi:hypothetical protein
VGAQRHHPALAVDQQERQQPVAGADDQQLAEQPLGHGPRVIGERQRVQHEHEAEVRPGLPAGKK